MQKQTRTRKGPAGCGANAQTRPHCPQSPNDMKSGADIGSLVARANKSLERLFSRTSTSGQTV